MPELRIDPIVGRRVYVAEDRAGRPSDYVAESLRDSNPDFGEIGQRVLVNSSCAFCAGNERQTPVASATKLDAEGRWLIRTVPNKYPAVTLNEPNEGAFGAHEVIIESPQHVLSVSALEIDHLTAVLAMFRDRLRFWAADGRLKHATLFKNSGFDAGASLEHVHSQLVALPYVPPVMQAELDGVARFHRSHRRCVFCDLIAREASLGERVVLQQDGYIAVGAYASRQPFETWILPTEHAARFEELEDDQLPALARVQRDLLRRLEAVAPGVAYNLLLHTGPFGVAEDEFHWHWELVPRLTHEAGLEWGGGVNIVPLSPEHAAAQLRAALNPAS